MTQGPHLNFHLQMLIELAYKTDPKTADYHLSQLQRELNYANLNERGIKELAMHLRCETNA